MDRRREFRKVLLSLALTLGVQPEVRAQGAGLSSPVRPGVSNPTVLPTDTLPDVVETGQRSAFEQLQIKALQKLPPKLYFTGVVESSFRYETNPYQDPTKRALLKNFPSAADFASLPPSSKLQLFNQLGQASNDDVVFRVQPNVTGGWAFTPRTRVGANYFLIRDSLCQHVKLNTNVQSVAGFVQHDVPIANGRGNLMGEMQFRELFQTNQQPVFDFLPTLTASYQVSPQAVVFASSVLQLRGKQPFQAPTKEIDPFYSVGALYQRRDWIYSASGTFFEAFRQPFGANALIRQNNYSFIADFEVARRLVKSLPGLQSFIRAEPIWNFHSNNRPGIAGMDFRLFWGLRMAASKRPIANVMDQIKEQIREQRPKGPQRTPPASPSTTSNNNLRDPQEYIASRPQPIHQFLPEPKPKKLVPPSNTIMMAIVESGDNRRAGRSLLSKLRPF